MCIRMVYIDHPKPRKIKHNLNVCLMGRKIIIILDGYIFDVYLLMIRTVDSSKQELLSQGLLTNEV